ncbi:helix-turn-helix domain containing protein [Amycolatopsis cynarae]|uniref:Helix-turn-helix domain containing protein n=1 Tax=Amycolatopsis cynarae TaxID=2995223 RepID=A0ABY7B4R2_9PSEU|nr:TetR/AcrR family transcriptional regulator [Amycolatopsis sp. HUAS 11-8]WAL66414.1 helix-turn-helix domain containing protein [Amycolatopsis sp. HUAS 11-8]
MPKIRAATVAEHRAMQRRAILDAAREILAEGGGAETPSLAAVAQRTGLARPSVYSYFKSRDDLLDALIIDTFPKWSAYVTEQMDKATHPGERALAYVDANLHLVARGEHAIVSALAATGRGELLEETSKTLHDQLRTPLVETLAQRGTRDPEAMAELIQAIVYAVTRMVEDGTPEADARRLARELLEPYFRS